MHASVVTKGERHEPLHGTIVPLVTPFLPDESVDREALGRLIDHVIEHEADGLMATALTGEGPLLEERETLEVWDTVFDRARGRRPVIPAVVSATTRQACRLVREAHARGAAAVMVAPILPELYAGRSADDAWSFYADVAQAASSPIVLFNYPSLTGVDLVPALVDRLATLDPILYIKESTADTTRIHDIQRRVGDRLSVICGAPNVALEALALGCTAWITGTLNVVPRSGKQLMRAVLERGDLALARRIYREQILPTVDVIRASSNPTGTIKAGVTARGVRVGAPRRPGHDLAEPHRQRLIEHLRDVDALERRTSLALEN